MLMAKAFPLRVICFPRNSLLREIPARIGASSCVHALFCEAGRVCFSFFLSFFFFSESHAQPLILLRIYHYTVGRPPRHSPSPTWRRASSTGKVNYAQRAP